MNIELLLPQVAPHLAKDILQDMSLSIEWLNPETPTSKTRLEEFAHGLVEYINENAMSEAAHNRATDNPVDYQAAIADQDTDRKNYLTGAAMGSLATISGMALTATAFYFHNKFAAAETFHHPDPTATAITLTATASTLAPLGFTAFFLLNWKKAANAVSQLRKNQTEEAITAAIACNVQCARHLLEMVQLKLKSPMSEASSGSGPQLPTMLQSTQATPRPSVHF
ncbi:MAG TPA: hypothetical protein VFR09_02610 [Alphaproteobacteria bacterium]|nr:hypothetical protein [Alphaproteobacteria bacterium]